jgi:hypothetical protein
MILVMVAFVFTAMFFVYCLIKVIQLTPDDIDRHRFVKQPFSTYCAICDKGMGDHTEE